MMAAKKQWMVQSAWMTVVGWIFLSLALTVAQRNDGNFVDDGQTRRSESVVSHGKYAPPFVNPRNLFAPSASNPKPPMSNLPSRSRQSGDWTKDLVWLKPVVWGGSIAYSPDGQLIAVTTYGFGEIGVYRISDEKWLTFISGHNNFVNSLAFSPNGQFLASGSSDKTVKIWRVSDGSLVKELRVHTDGVQSVAFSPDGKFFASGSKDKTVQIWRVSDWGLQRTLIGHTDAVNSIAFSPDSQFLASSSLDRTIRVWRVSDGNLVRTLVELASPVAFSPDGQYLAAGTWDGYIRLWRVSDWDLDRTLTTQAGFVIFVAFSPNGEYLASASGSDVKLWRVSDGMLVRTLTGHTSSVTSIAFSPDSKFLASVGYDNTFRIWRVSDGSLVKVSDGHSSWVSSVSFSPDGQTLISGSYDKTVRMWDATNGSLLKVLTEHKDGVTSVAFSPNGQIFASGSSDETVKLWRASDGSLIQTLTGHTQSVNSIAFSHDGRYLASGSEDETIKIWHVFDGTLVKSLGNTAAILSVAFSPGGQFLASLDSDDAVKIWRFSDGSLARTFGCYGFGVAFSPDGKLLAFQDWDLAIKLWNVSDGSLVKTLTGSTGIVLSIAFSPDGQFLASGSFDNTIRIWRIADGSLIKVFTLPTHYGVFSVAFSPNTQFLASASSHGLAVWRLGTLTPNNPPSVPTLISPADNSTLTTSPFQLKLSATDPDMQRLKFKVELLRNGQVMETFDQTKDTSGWDKAFYASGETATLTISQLAPGNYRWRAYAFDGLDWSSVSEIRNFVFAPQIQWTFYEPIGDVVQIPIFRVKATISGLPSTEKLQYRIEISGDPQFRQNVLIFDQSVEPTMWSKDKYAPDESAGFVARYVFPLYTPLHWRARVKRVGESNWSEPSPSQSFQVMRGFSFSMLEQIRVGRTEQIPVTVVNPYNEPIDLILAAVLSLNTDEFSGTAKVIAPGGVVMDEITFGQEKSYLEAFLRDLPAGTHTFTIQLEVRSTRHHNGTNERIIAPLLSFSLEVLGSWAMSFLLERACESVARTVLGNHGFSPIDANKEIDRLKDAAQDEIVDKGTKQAISELEKRGGGKLLKKVAGKLSPFTGIVSAIDDCVEGIKNAFSGGGDMSVVRSWDPNMKAGVIGREGFIQANEPLPYRILFENIPPPPPALPAPAQEVTITDDLDEDIDLSTFTFTSVGFGNHAFSFPVGTKVLSIDVDLRPEGKNLIVQIRGGLVERRMTVTFKGINPETGQLHPDGFLPVNENPPEGEGWVAFEVRLKEDVRSGAQVKNKASIKFDVNEPQSTNEVVVTVDKVAPQSKVTEITGARALLRKQSLLATDNGRCVDCGVQQQGNIEVHFEASDDVSGVDIVELWVSEQKVNFRGTRQVIIGERKYRLASTLSGSAAPKFSFRGRFGYNYRFYTVARDVAGNKEPEPDDSDARIAIGQPPTLPAGLYMVSVPVESEDADPKQVFLFESNKWARWNPEARNGQGDYVLYDNDPNGFTRFGESEKVPGRGYWVRIPQQTIIQVYGNLPDETKPFAIPLKKGWNQIGNPWLEDLIWDVSAIKVKFNGQTKALKDLTQGEAVAPYAWRWDGNKYSLIYGTGNKLPSWEGAWVYAYSNCELILSPPSQSKGRETRDAGREMRGDGWTMKLTAQVGSEIGEAILGVSQDSRGFAVGLPPEPPEESSKVKVIMLNSEVPLAVDIRSNLKRQQTWDIAVKWDTGQRARNMGQIKEITLTFDGIGYAPKDVSLWFVDMVTGKRLYMRTQPSYRFATQEGETERRFKVIAELGNERNLKIVGLKAIPMKGQGVVIEFALTKPAQVQTEILTLTGRKVATLENRSNKTAGRHGFVWKGIDTEGRKVGSGIYLVRVSAVDDDGRQVQATTAVRLR